MIRGLGCLKEDLVESVDDVNNGQCELRRDSQLPKRQKGKISET